MYAQAKYLPAGDKGLVVEFGDTISYAVNSKVRGLAFALAQDPFPGLIDYIPTYRSLLILYDPLLWKPDWLIARLKQMEQNLAAVTIPRPRVYHLPVVYGGEYGPDLPFICQHTRLSREDIIAKHSEIEYLVYMLGFTPGFPYLGGMNQELATPRLKTPRTKIPAGSVGIAGGQTGIYPVESPGGWRIIGRTPVRLYDPHNTPPVLLNAGDYIKFYAVTIKEYESLTKEIAQGTFKIITSDFIGVNE